MGRAPCCEKTNVKKGPWSPEEDAKLKAYIEQNGTGGNWIALPQKIGLKRCGKSCRLRWLNYLRPNIKHGGFSEEEDNIICSLYISIGSRWSIIAAQLPGRTDNDIKNYWNTRLKKKLLGRRKDSQISTHRIIEEDDGLLHDLSAVVVSHTGEQLLSSSALERMQHHLHLQSLKSPYLIFNPLASFNSVGQEPSPLDGNLPVVQNHQFETHNVLGIESLSANSLEHIDTNSSIQSKERYFTEFSSSSVFAIRDDVQSVRAIEGFPAQIHQMMHSDHEQIDRFDASKEMDGSMLWWWNNDTNSSIQSKERYFTEFSSSSVAAIRDDVQSVRAIEGFPAQIHQMMHYDHEQIDRFDASKKMDGSMLWWWNDADQKATNSWDSAFPLQHEAFSLRELGLEYGLL